MSDQIMVGGYTVHHEVGEKELELFKKTIDCGYGVDRKLLAVASQLVSGVNYIFIYTAKPVVLHPTTELKATQVYVSFEPNAQPSIVWTKTLDVAKL